MRRGGELNGRRSLSYLGSYQSGYQGLFESKFDQLGIFGDFTDLEKSLKSDERAIQMGKVLLSDYHTVRIEANDLKVGKNSSID